MRNRGVRKELMDRVKEIYERTKNGVRVNGMASRKFNTVKVVRQGCPMSPILFSLYVADVEKQMRKDKEEEW